MLISVGVYRCFSNTDIIIGSILVGLLQCVGIPKFNKTSVAGSMLLCLLLSEEQRGIWDMLENEEQKEVWLEQQCFNQLPLSPRVGCGGFERWL